MSYFFIVTGLVIIFFGAIGIIILPDLFLRFHAATKCTVTGIINILLGLMIYSADLEIIIKLFIIMVFILASSPITVHLIAVSFVNSKPDDKEDKNGN